MTSRKELTHMLMIIVAAMMWGFGFSIQSIGARHVDTFTFLTGRSWLAFLIMLPVICVVDRVAGRQDGGAPGAQTAGSCAPAAGTPSAGSFAPAARRLFPMRGGSRKDLWLGSLLAGLFSFGTVTAQQIGVAHTTSAKVGFLTAMYVVIVPLLSLFLKKRPEPKIWFCVALAVAGLFFLCMKGSFSLQFGDAIVLLAALSNSFQVLLIAHYVQRTELFRFTTLQFFFGAVFSTICMIAFEQPTWAGVRAALPAILYAGIIANCVAFTLQVIGQRELSPTLTGIAMSMESVFSAIAGLVVLHQFLTARELLGCALMFAAILLSQITLPAHKPKKKALTG